MIFFTLLLLAIMEVSLSFDNAIINASVLRDMPPVWQRRFLTWGMPVAVFGMRLAFPVLLVACAGWISIPDVIMMAINDPDAYAEHLNKGHVVIDAFGGIFLLMTFLSFHCDEDKEIHWLVWIEKPLAFLTRIHFTQILPLAIMIAIGLSTNSYDMTVGGTAAYLLFTLLNCVDMKQQTTNGLLGFLYLEVLDASCSFDGVIAAFVLTNNIFVIMAGLGIGALAIRSLTLYLVHGGMLKNYRYLEHGAHYGIGALAVIMLADIFYSVPEPVTGMIGMSFIGLSLLSSILHNRRLSNG